VKARTLGRFRGSRARGQTYRVSGAAWTTEAEITKVEISTTGRDVAYAHLLGEPIRNACGLGIRLEGADETWESQLMARATDRKPHPTKDRIRTA